MAQSCPYSSRFRTLTKVMTAWNLTLSLATSTVISGVFPPLEELMRSLIERNAIPPARLNYFTHPDYFIGGHGRSRLQRFMDGGTKATMSSVTAIL